MSFESFSHSLAYMLISELSGTEIPAMQTDILPAHRIVSLQQCACIIAQGEGLTEDRIKGQSEMLLEAIKKGSFPSKSESVCVIYVFKQPCPAILKKKITSLAKRPPVSLSNRAVFGGFADLSDGSAGMNGDYTISAVASLLKKTVKLFHKGELRLEDEGSYGDALEKLDKKHIDFAMKLSDTTPWATYALTGICVLMFIWESIIGGSDNSMVLLRMGATSSTLVMGGEWWRLIGSMFLHIGIIHLIVNMYALISVGGVLERYLGNIKFLALYALSGVAGSAASAFMGTQVGAGASGAIFGLFGAAALIGWRYRNEIPTAFRNQLAGGMAVTIIYNLLYGFGHQGIDNSAHIGGLVAGLIFAALVPPEVTGSDKGRHLSGAQTTLFIFIALCMFAT
jgi:membrane associated rhomboid family serine protease